MSFRRAINPESDPGQWFTYGKDGAGKLVRFRIRRLMPKVATRIEEECEVRDRSLVIAGSQRPAGGARKGDTIIGPGNTAAELKAGVKKAAACLADSENCVVTPVGPEDAQAYTEAMGEAVTAGQDLTLDGKWTEKLRDRFLSDELEVAAWVVTKARQMGVRVQREEAEADEGKENG